MWPSVSHSIPFNPCIFIVSVHCIVFVWISLITNSVEYLFMSLLATCISPLEKCLVMLFLQLNYQAVYFQKWMDSMFLFSTLLALNIYYWCLWYFPHNLFPQLSREPFEGKDFVSYMWLSLLWVGKTLSLPRTTIHTLMIDARCNVKHFLHLILFYTYNSMKFLWFLL